MFFKFNCLFILLNKEGYIMKTLKYIIVSLAIAMAIIGCSSSNSSGMYLDSPDPTHFDASYYERGF